MSIKFKDNSQEILEKFKQAKNNALEAIGMAAEGYVQDETPVDTGRLRHSITWASKEHEGFTHSYSDNNGNSFSDSVGSGADEDSVYIGTNVVYAEGIETGTHRKAGGAHMIQRGIQNNQDEYKRLAENEFKNA